MGGLQDGQMLAHRLTGHVEADAQLAQVLAIAGVQPIEEQAPARVGQCLEHLAWDLAWDLVWDLAGDHTWPRPRDGPDRTTGHRSPPIADLHVVRIRHTRATARATS